MNLDQARDICLSFPGAVEGQHHGHPDFRLKNKIFASLQPEKELAVLRLPLEMAEAMATERPECLRLVSRFGGAGWVAIELASFDLAEFANLTGIAFGMRAGK